MSQLAIVPNRQTTAALQRIDALEATHAASYASERYGFVSTRSIIDNLASEGFALRSVQIQKVRSEKRQGFQMHLLRFRHESLNQIAKVGDVFPELVIRNSHDCSSSLLGMLGMFRMICSNGLVSGNIEDAFRVTHRIASVQTVTERVLALTARAGRMVEVMERLQSRLVTSTEATDFILEAAKIRYPEPNDRQLHALRNIRREEDTQPNAWTLFNRVQENLTQGGRATGMRRITGAHRDLAVNRSLWNLAEAAFLN